MVETKTREQIALDLKKVTEEKRKKEAEDKKKKAKIKEKKNYDVRVETTLPAILTYKSVLAESPEQALQLTKNLQPNGVQYKLNRRRDIKATVYAAGSLIILLIKNLVGM